MPGEAGHSSQYLITDDEASLSPQPKSLPDGTEGHYPVYVIDDDGELLYPALHSTPSPSNQETEYFYRVDNMENPVVMQENETVMANFNSINGLDETDDSGVVQIGSRSEDGDGELASTLPMIDSHLEIEAGNLSEVSVLC